MWIVKECIEVHSFILRLIHFNIKTVFMILQKFMNGYINNIFQERKQWTGSYYKSGQQIILLIIFKWPRIY